MRRLLRAWTFFREDRARIVMVLLALAAGIGANLLKPWPLAVIVDSVLGEEAAPAWLDAGGDKMFLLLLLGGFILVIYTAHGALSALQNYVSIQVGLRGLTRVRRAIFEKLQQLSLRYHQRTSAGDLIHRAAWDTYSFQTVFQQGVVTFVTALFTLVLMLIVMSQLNMRLTIVACGLVPLLMLVMQFLGRHMRERGVLAQQADSRVTSCVEQSIRSMPLIQSDTLEARESGRFKDCAYTSEQRRLSQHGSELLYWTAISIVFGLGMAVIVWVGSHQVIAGALTLGELLIFVAYLGQLYEPLNQLSHVGATVATAGAGVQRVFEILDTGDEVAEAPDARPLLRGRATEPKSTDAPQPLVVRGAIAFENVGFGYEPERRVLEDLSFNIGAGKSVAIIGPSGAGKTTLLNLLPRFFDPQAGAVKLDGCDLRELRLKDLRQSIAMVFQEPILLPGTIADNIALSRPDAGEDAIRQAAEDAGAAGFIRELPKGFDTVIGDGAVRLSVGEKQRIAIARAFLKDAPILLLDEPTSALDAASEQAVLEGFARLMKGRTSIVVAHRLKTIHSADYVLVLQDGKITEQGGREELLARGGYFATVFQADGG